jgi:hypothetical protein
MTRSQSAGQGQNAYCSADLVHLDLIRLPCFCSICFLEASFQNKLPSIYLKRAPSEQSQCGRLWASVHATHPRGASDIPLGRARVNKIRGNCHGLEFIGVYCLHLAEKLNAFRFPILSNAWPLVFTPSLPSFSLQVFRLDQSFFLISLSRLVDSPVFSSHAYSNFLKDQLLSFSCTSCSCDCFNMKFQIATLALAAGTASALQGTWEQCE